jgi:hypothetical protein
VGISLSWPKSPRYYRLLGDYYLLQRPLSVTGCSFRPQRIHSGSEDARCGPRRHRFWLQASRLGDDRPSLKEATSGYRKGRILMP